MNRLEIVSTISVSMLSIAVILTCNWFGIVLGVIVLIGNMIEAYFAVRRCRLEKEQKRILIDLREVANLVRNGDVLHVQK